MNPEIVMNNSWSGSTICNTGYRGDCSDTSSFIHRREVLIEDGFLLKIKLTECLCLAEQMTPGHKIYAVN